MGSKAVVSVYLIISLCAAIFVTRGVAQMQNLQAIPGLFPPGLVAIDLVKCWSSLFTVQGCVLAISNSFFSGKFENVEAACCKLWYFGDIYEKSGCYKSSLFTERNASVTHHNRFHDVSRIRTEMSYQVLIPLVTPRALMANGPSTSAYSDCGSLPCNN
ncbi:hypothetical protein YC2023_022337 [Brassica napus]